MTDPFSPIVGVKANGAALAPAQWVIISPVPSNAPPAPEKHPKLGSPTARWTYRDAAGALLGFILRFDGTTGKQFRPLALYAPAGGGAPVWRWEAWPSPRPLYGLDRLAARPAASVLVCEGEKAADAAGRLAGAFVCIAAPNGAKSAAKADWAPLRGRRVVIWPDADAPGADYAKKVAALCSDAGAVSVVTLAPPAGVSDGWDAADAERDGWTAARVEALIAGATPLAESPSSAPKEKTATPKKKRRPPQRDSLMALTRDCALWHGPDYSAYVTIPVNGHRENCQVRSQAFRRWLAVRAYEQSGFAPGAQALEDTLRVLEARAVSEGAQQAPWRRVGVRDGCLYVDLGDPDWRAIEVHAGGWYVVKSEDLPFVRAPRMRALCEPVRGGSIDELRPFVNAASDADFVLAVSWLIAAFRERGPYPILTLNGEQGTGKSYFSRVIRSLVDPSSPAIQALPKEERDLIVCAQNSHILSFDNVSRVDGDMSDSLCRLATGAGFAVRANYTDSDENIFDGARPILLNGIPALAERPDLMERSIVVRLAPVREDMRLPEDELDAAWEMARPRVLGALCDALSTALANVDRVRLPRAGRMADFEKWMTAAEPGLGWSDGTFADAYRENRRDGAEAAFENDVVAVSLAKFWEREEKSGFREWRGTASALLPELCTVTNDATQQMRIWPKTAQALGNAIARAAPLLRSNGIAVDRHHSGDRKITIYRLPEHQPRAGARPGQPIEDDGF